jgi:DNA-binding NtrC family response regulator
MVRPCFLVVDPEFPGSISTRKLVIETAKLNVITAYGASEATETLGRFPGVNAIVLNATVEGIPCGELIDSLRAIVATVPIIVTSAGGHADCGQADYRLDSYDPKSLLDLLVSLDQDASREVKRRDEELL